MRVILVPLLLGSLALPGNSEAAPAGPAQGGASTLWSPPASGAAAEACTHLFATLRDIQNTYTSTGNAEGAAITNGQYRDAWNACAVDVAKAERVKQAEAAEHRKAAELAALEERQRQWAEERASQPDWFVPVLSAAICDARGDQQAARQAIADEKAAARRSGGGVVDLGAIYNDQSRMREAEQEERNRRAMLKARKKAPLPCGAPAVRHLSDTLEFSLVLEAIDALETE